MAVVTVPRPLQEQLGEAATDSLVGMFQQLEAAREQQQDTHKDHLFELLEERFLRHVAESEGRLRAEIAESENRLRAEMQAGFNRQQDQLARQQDQLARQQEQIAGLGKQIADVRADMHQQIAGVHKQIALQTRWILAALGAAAVLFPIIQRVMQVLLP